MPNIFKLNDTVIKRPTEFSIEKYNLTKGERTGSGLMKIRYIAAKRKFLFNYTVISGPELDAILNVINTVELFFTLTYEENSVVKTAKVYVGAIKSKKFRSDGVWYWKDVSFDLIEQ